MVQLYSKVSNPLDVGVLTKREMEGESRDIERLFDDNKSLRDQLELLKSQARYTSTSPPPLSLSASLSLPLSPCLSSSCIVHEYNDIQCV